MAIGVVDRKCGTACTFAEEGISIPVTVIEIEPNRVTQFETEETDGYRVIQVIAGERRASRVTKAQADRFAKANVTAGRSMWEFRLGEEQYATGDQITVDLLQTGQMVDVTGKSKGKGFAGTIKRQNFRGQDNTRGNSVSHRVPGSINQCQTLGRVFKGRKVSGHLGTKRVTVRSLEIMRVDTEHNLLLVKGAVPGAAGGDVIVRPTAKTRG